MLNRPAARLAHALALALFVLALSACAPPAPANESAAQPPPAALLAQPAFAAEAATPTPPPTATRRSLASTATATNTPELSTATPSGPTSVSTPTPRPAGTPPRVGLQVGHWKSDELPDELARLRNSTGARYGNVTEAELNLDVATRIKPLLEAEGVIVDLIPATVPPGYDADAFIAIHADGSNNPAARGWKLATPWRASRAAQFLFETVAAAYGPATGLPEDVGGVTVNMKGYYAFNYRRHVHAIAPTTPAIIVEMGFMTSAADRNLLFGQPDLVARGIANGVLAYLRQRDPNDGAALLPPDYPNLRTSPDGATMRAAPSDDARVIARLSPDSRVFAIDRRDGWYQIYARDVPSTPGWVREDQLVTAPPPNGTPPPEPTSTNP